MCIFLPFRLENWKKMENFNTYKVNELIEVYEFLKEKGQTTLAVLTAKDEIKKVIAAKLKIAKTDVVKRLSKKKEEKKEEKTKEITRAYNDLQKAKENFAIELSETLKLLKIIQHQLEDLKELKELKAIDSDVSEEEELSNDLNVLLPRGNLV